MATEVGNHESRNADSSPLPEVYGQYLQVAEAWAAEFARQKQIYGEKIHCAKGCSECCSHPFQITEVEAAAISRAVKNLPPEARSLLEARARAYLPRWERLLSERSVPDAWGSLPPPGMRLPCPALSEDAACTIYEHRPFICRKYGVALYNPAKPDQVFACELNFAPGEEIEENGLVQIQTELHERWLHASAEYNRQGLLRVARPITVARAILEDFEQCLPSNPSNSPTEGS